MDGRSVGPAGDSKNGGKNACGNGLAAPSVLQFIQQSLGRQAGAGTAERSETLVEYIIIIMRACVSVCIISD